MPDSNFKKYQSISQKRKNLKEVLYDLQKIFMDKRSSERDNIALFLKPVENDVMEISEFEKELDVELILDEADQASKETDVRYHHKEVFSKVRRRISEK